MYVTPNHVTVRPDLVSYNTQEFIHVAFFSDLFLAVSRQVSLLHFSRSKSKVTLTCQAAGSCFSSAVAASAASACSISMTLQMDGWLWSSKLWNRRFQVVGSTSIINSHLMYIPLCRPETRSNTSPIVCMYVLSADTGFHVAYRWRRVEILDKCYGGIANTRCNASDLIYELP